MHDAAPLVLAILGALLSLGFAWRAYLYQTDAPDAPALTQQTGPRLAGRARAPLPLRRVARVPRGGPGP